MKLARRPAQHRRPAGGANPEEGRQAAAGIATVTSLSIAFGTAVAGALVNLGGGSMLDSARYVLFGLALLCALGALTAHAANRTDPAADREDAPEPRRGDARSPSAP